MRLFRTSVVSVAPMLPLLRPRRLPRGLSHRLLPRRVPLALAVAALAGTVSTAVGQQRGTTSRGGAAVASRGPARDQNGAAPLVLAGVTVIDVETGRRVPRQTVMIVGSRISALGPATTVRIPPGARVVDARGKFLIPGLWDMHVHPSQYADVAHPLYIANGVTGVRDAGSDVPLSTLTRWKQEIAAGTRVGPRLFVAGPAVDECPGAAVPHHVCVSTPDEARQLVDFLKQAGADFVKPYALSRELYLAIAREARRVGIPFGGHLAVSAYEASDSGARFLDHGYYLDSCGSLSFPDTTKIDMAQCAAGAQRLRRNNTWAVLTRDSRASYQREQYRQYYPDELLAADCFPRDSFIALIFRQAPVGPRPTSLAEWKAARLGWIDSATRSPMATLDQGWERLEAARVPIVAATDAVLMPGGGWFMGLPGLTLPEVLAGMVTGGMSPLAALQTATVNPALAWQATDSLGTVAAGKLADLVLLDADPLADIWNTTKIRAVFANGRYFDRAALDQLLAQAEQAAHRPVGRCLSGGQPAGAHPSGQGR